VSYTSEQHREYYLANKEKYLASARASKARNKEKLRVAKSKPCTDCGKEFPWYCMDFDHVNGEKLFEVSSAGVQKHGWTKSLLEIAKCELVCAICHRIRTQTRLGCL
jgi:hypothetical protein